MSAQDNMECGWSQVIENSWTTKWAWFFFSELRMSKMSF